ncbi:hypothetical protein DL771_006894 [Monosporascus sp. 5C6A]|nr:hypothetical protein DL771_006894 [Monosporascus sp. 5C6A]
MAPDTGSSERHGLFLLHPAHIVAIHGLGGDAFKTWTDKDGHLWLRDSLPAYISGARIMTYGYDSAVVFGSSQMSVDDFSIDLLSRLDMGRRAPEEKLRPLIFVCHSLGGVVFKQALISAALQGAEYQDILKSTHGVIFMGTPHRGSRAASPAGQLSKIINVATLGTGARSDLLDVLKVSSRVLDRVSRQSAQILQRLSIVSFYEQKPLGPTLIVEPFSAILGLPNERAIPINADHRQIARVSPRTEHRFLPVWKALAELAEGCLLETASNSKELLDELYCVDYKTLQLRPRQAHLGSCDWLLRHDTFHKWVQSETSTMLLLSGPAGVGKSVLTRFLVEEIMAGSQNVPLTRGYVVASYFCSYNEATCISDTVILRSILHQLVQINPQSQNLVKNKLQNRTQYGLVYQLTRDRLWAAIVDVLSLDTMRRVFIALDAIEELPLNSAVDILAGFWRVISRINRRQPNHRLRVFVSSRHNAAYLTVLKSTMVIRITGAEVKPSIEAYVRDSIAEFARTNESFGEAVDHVDRETILKKIVERADGMFLWSVVAWEDFRRGLLWNRDVVQERLQELDSTPMSINALYDRVMGQVQPDIRKDMWSIFSILAVAARPLQEIELSILLAMRKAGTQPEYSKDIDPFANLGHIIEKNFPELVVIHNDNTITFSHLSFKEYLSQYWSEKDPDWLGKAHYGIAQAVITYLKLQDLVEDSRRATSQKDLDRRNSQGRVALHHLVHYADEEVLSKFLDNCIFDVNVQDRIGYTPLYLATTMRKLNVMKRLLNVYGVRVDLTDNQGRTPLTLATYWGHKAAALVLIEHSQAFPTPERGQLSSLVCAASQSDKELSLKLLEKYRYRNLNYHIDLSGKGVLHHAALNNWSDILTRCLVIGNDDSIVNQLDHSGGTAIHGAAALGNTAACETLLAHGASIRLQDRNGRTAAHAAADAGFKDTLMVLLSAPDIDVNQKDLQGRNLVHWAATLDCVDVMELIVRKPGAKISCRDNMGLMPIDIAFRCKCPTVGRFLSMEMQARARGSQGFSWTTLYPWDYLYNSPEVTEIDEYWKVENDTLLTRESRRARRMNDEWQALHREYPDEQWALTWQPRTARGAEN